MLLRFPLRSKKFFVVKLFQSNSFPLLNDANEFFRKQNILKGMFLDVAYIVINKKRMDEKASSNFKVFLG